MEMLPVFQYMLDSPFLQVHLACTTDSTCDNSISLHFFMIRFKCFCVCKAFLINDILSCCKSFVQ